jgi:hypothetical protein
MLGRQFAHDLQLDDDAVEADEVRLVSVPEPNALV